jgi:hypothetical protein
MPSTDYLQESDEDEPLTSPGTPDALHRSTHTMWTFSLKPDESVLARWYRLFDELLTTPAGVDVNHPPGVLADFLNVVGRPGDPVAIIAGKPTSHIEQWRTNCAMTQHAAMVHCGHAMKPDVNGETIFQYLELSRGDDRWVENDGKNRPVGPAIFYVSPSPTFVFDHVGAFGPAIDAAAGHYSTAEGGGGDGTHIGKSDRVLSQPDRFGRHIAGWWEIADQLPPSAESVHDHARDTDVAPPMPTSGNGAADE